MPNTLTTLTPQLMAGAFATYLSTKSAMIGRVRTGVYEEAQMAAQGGSAVTIQRPARGPAAPSVWTPGTGMTSTGVTTEAVTLTMNRKFGDQFDANVFEDAVAQRGFQQAFDLVFPSYLDGIIEQIDTDLTALAVSAAQQAGTGGVALTDATLRAAIAKITTKPYNVRLDPSRVFFVGGNSAYWNDLLKEDRYALAMNTGRPDILASGNLTKMYNITFDYSPNLLQTSLSGTTTTHNLMFHRDFAVIGFMKFRDPAAYGSPNVEVANVTDPETGISLQLMRWFDPNTDKWYWKWKVCYGVTVYDSYRAVEVLS